jgi:arylsulfatase A-like enzyme
LSPEYAATIEALDLNIGRLMDQLSSIGITDNTFLIFTSDNGGSPENVAPLNGSKGSLYDGGLRVPAFIWGSTIKNPGRQSAMPITSTDFFPTILEITKCSPPSGQPLDGQSLMPLLRGTDLPARDLFWHFPCYIGRGSPSSAIRRGNHKLIQWFENERVELFDLSQDPGESRNIASANPKIAAVLLKDLKAWQVRTGALLPGGANPDYDPIARNRDGSRNDRGKGKRAG